MFVSMFLPRCLIFIFILQIDFFCSVQSIVSVENNFSQKIQTLSYIIYSYFSCFIIIISSFIVISVYTHVYTIYKSLKSD